METAPEIAIEIFRVLPDPLTKNTNVVIFYHLFDASTAFFDPFLVSGFDVEHSVSEDRYGIIGKMDNEKLIHVFYTFRGESVRLISARKATPKEGLEHFTLEIVHTHNF